MYSEMQEQLRLSLTQFFGAILVNSQFKDSTMKKQSLVALVMEELLKVCKTQDDITDMIVAKPILRAGQFLLERRNCEIQEELKKNNIDEELIEDATEDLQWMIADLEKYIASLEDINK